MTNEELSVLLDRLYEKGREDAYRDIFKQLTPIIAQLQNIPILTEINRKNNTSYNETDG